jgi:hypothetical protein
MGLLDAFTMTAAERQTKANTELRTANAPADILEMQAGGIDTRQIPGLLEALGTGGAAVKNALLQNPQAPRMQGQQALMQAGAQRQAVADRTAATAEKQADLNLRQAEQAFQNPEMMTDQVRFGIEGTLRDDFNNAFDTVEESVNSYQQVVGALAEDSRAGALAAVMKFARVLDPGSVVRQQEGKAVSDAAAGSIGNQLIQAYNLAAGKGFTQAAKADLMGVLEAVTRPTVQRGVELVSNYQGIADRNPALDINNIMANKTSALEFVQEALTTTVNYGDL